MHTTPMRGGGGGRGVGGIDVVIVQMSQMSRVSQLFLQLVIARYTELCMRLII